MQFEEVSLVESGFSGNRLPQQKFMDNENALIYVFPEFSNRKIRAHYAEGMGVFLCLSSGDQVASCCKSLKTPGTEAKDKYLMVYMKYMTKKDGTPVSPCIDEGEVYFLLAPPGKRNAISMELQKGAVVDQTTGATDLTRQDLMIHCEASKTQILKVTTTGANTSLKDLPENQEAFKKAYEKAKAIYDAMAEKAVIVYTPAQLEVKLANKGYLEGATPAQTGGQVFTPPAQATTPMPAPAGLPETTTSPAPTVQTNSVENEDLDSFLKT